MSETDDDDTLVTLATFSGEIEATLAADELTRQGIRAQASGTLTAGFRAEAPGSVKVLVYEKDLPEAQRILDDYTQSRKDIDWDSVDVGEMEDGAGEEM
ncbi:MAG: DUF2007 domain-containing protein [Planctomycetota bacterium]